jgi:prepilin-type N-terminal cleavage/methylation domain-containing protein
MKFVLIGLQAVFRQTRSIDGMPVKATAAGFTLLETLTALTILAIALVSLFEAHARGLHNAGIATDYAEARILAQGLLADTVSGRGGSVISGKGRIGRFDWSIDVAPERAPWSEIKSEKSWRLDRVRVTVAWDKDRRIELDTLKLGRPNE